MFLLNDRVGRTLYRYCSDVVRSECGGPAMDLFKLEDACLLDGFPIHITAFLEQLFGCPGCVCAYLVSNLTGKTFTFIGEHYISKISWHECLNAMCHFFFVQLSDAIYEYGRHPRLVKKSQAVAVLMPNAIVRSSIDMQFSPLTQRRSYQLWQCLRWLTPSVYRVIFPRSDWNLLVGQDKIYSAVANMLRW